MGNAFFNEYPYTDFHEMNLTWVIQTILKMDKSLKEFIINNTIKYADPIQWDITRQYEENTIVIEANSGTAYLSVKPVPVGVDITNTDYWTPVFTLDLLASNHNLTVNDEGVGLISSKNYIVGAWLLINSELYVVTRDISQGNAFVFEGENANVKRITVEEENEIIYYAQDKKLTIHGKIDDYSEIVVGGDRHIYRPRIKAIEILSADQGGE